MTDDLDGRLDHATLESSPRVASIDRAEEPDFYSQSQLVFPADSMPPLLSPPKASFAIVFGVGETHVLDGNLQSVSFGSEGWLCTISVEDAKLITPIVVRASKDPITSVQVALDGGLFSMFKNVDCAASFSYGLASFTVTSDEAHYV